MAGKAQPLVWMRCRGRNGFDNPLDVPDDMGTECRNILFGEGGLGSKRHGSSLVTLTGDTFSGYNALMRFVPGGDETAAELFIVSGDATVKILRVAGGTAADDLTLVDAISERPQDVHGVPLNGKLWLFGMVTAENRIYVFDPGLSTTSIRRGGLAVSAAPTAATQGGSGLSFTRYYKTAYTEQRSSVTARRAELSASVSVTISDDTGVTVTKPAAISEGETHWEVWASDTATGTYYLLGTTAVGTTTFSDTNATIPTTTAEAVAGTYLPFLACKYGATDGSRLAGFGSIKSQADESLIPQKGTFYFGPVLDSTSTHDDERIAGVTGAIGKLPLSRNSNAEDRGLAYFDNCFWAFQSKGIYQIIPTEDPTGEVPFVRVQRSKSIGLLRHQTLVESVDEFGRPAMYFLDPVKGPYRYGANGFQWIGRDVADLWATVNHAATTVTAWGMADPDRNLVLWWVSAGVENEPTTTLIVFDVTEGRTAAIGPNGHPADVRYGWANWGGATGTFQVARCGVLFAASMGASMGRVLVPYIGRKILTATQLLKYDTSVYEDNGQGYTTLVKSKAWDGDVADHNKAILTSHIIANAATNVTINQSLIRNLGDESARTSVVLLTATGSETVVMRKFEDAALMDAWCFQVQLDAGGDDDLAWSLHRWIARIEVREAR